MTIKEIFLYMTGKALCAHCDCDECHNVFGTNSCPLDLRVSKENMISFVRNAVALVRKAETENMFDWEMTEEDLVDILMKAADKCTANNHD